MEKVFGSLFTGGGRCGSLTALLGLWDDVLFVPLLGMELKVKVALLCE